MNEYLFLITGIVAGFALGILLAKISKPTKIDTNTIQLKLEKEQLLKELSILNNQNKELSNRIEDLLNKNTSLESKLAAEQARLEKSLEVFNQQKNKIEEVERLKTELIAENSRANESIKNLLGKVNESKAELEALQKKLTVEFENIANKILEEKSQKFTQQNKEQLGQIISPFETKIKEFEKTVQETYVKGTKENSALLEQIKNLADLNKNLSTDAQNLALALRGDKKSQGNWGEFILENVLERSGLIKDIHFKIQHSTTNDEGSRVQPDVVILLPEDKHLIVDSKVSLNAYNDWANAGEEATKEQLMKQHLLNTRNHIKSLSEKNYHKANNINTPEFVLMFIPIEASFSAMIQADHELWNYAWERKIVIVGPSTLFATLRTIASVWNHEKQAANHLEIAKQAGDLYDKFVGFVEDMLRIEKNIKQTQSAYDDAMNKLKTGNGNLMRKTENLKELGAKASKAIPKNLLDNE